MKPFSDACEQNKRPILEVLQTEFVHCRSILEIGSGTGQHAVFFANEMPYLNWQTSDVHDAHAGIIAWLEQSGLENVGRPLTLEIGNDTWPERTFDGIFSANTTHIMSWPEVELMFAGVSRMLVANGIFCLYGPFNYKDSFTSESNARFDVWLKQRDPRSGVRDFERLDALAESHAMSLTHDYEMPVNNRILVWKKKE